VHITVYYYIVTRQMI